MKQSIRGKVFVVSGCPRSGTSVTMDILRHLYGEDMIMGSSLLVEDKTDEEIEADLEASQKEFLESIPNEGIRKVKAYEMSRADARHPERKEKRAKRRALRKEAQSMNPNGFFEDRRFSVRGINRVMRAGKGRSEIFDAELKEMLVTPKILKVVSNGLLASDPIYINRVLILNRHPRAVAKSQERLRGGIPEIEGHKNTRTDTQGRKQDIVKHSPQMYIRVHMQTLEFIQANPDIPIKIVQYENVLSDPKNVIESIHKFTGFEGDLEAGQGVVDPKLNRSKHMDKASTLWEDAEYIHKALCTIETLLEDNDRESIEKVIDETFEYFDDPTREINILQRQWFCLRAKTNTSAALCEGCMLVPEAAANLRKKSEAKVVPGVRTWVDEPCLFECGMDVKRKSFVSIEDSIYKNWWRKGVPYPLEAERSK